MRDWGCTGRWQATLVAARMQVECELPNSSLYTFTGNLVLGGQTLPLTPNQARRQCAAMRGRMRTKCHLLFISVVPPEYVLLCHTTGPLPGHQCMHAAVLPSPHMDLA